MCLQGNNPQRQLSQEYNFAVGTPMPESPHRAAKSNYGLAWFLLAVAFALHVWDEAAHNFLTYYNATALTLHGRFPWMPRMDMSYKTWLVGLLAAIALDFVLTPFAYRNSLRLRPLAYAIGVIQTLNGLHHIVLAIRGRSIGPVVFDGPAPGVYSSPALLLASAYLFWSLHKTSPRRTLLSPASTTS
jgi:hypothetical protein